MLYLQIYCPYKHEWKVVDEKYYVDEKKTFLFVCLFVSWWCKVEFALNAHIHKINQYIL